MEQLRYPGRSEVHEETVPLASDTLESMGGVVHDQLARQFRIVTYVLWLVTTVIALYLLVPTTLDFYKLFFLCAVASVAGAGFWNAALWVTKRLGLELETTNPFGGKREPNLYGGTAFGLFYFLPLALILAFVDVKVRHLPATAAAVGHALSLAGTMAGAALFYGPKIRQRVQRRGWSQGAQESWLAIVWSAMLVAPAVFLYELGKGLWATGPEAVHFGLAAIASLGSVIVCYLSVLFFMILCTHDGDPHEDARGQVMGFVIIFVLALAHEFSRSP
jgi:hypothetical protein